LTDAKIDPALVAHFNSDPFACGLGITLDEVRPGYARMSMPATEQMKNFHGTIHGGATFALADAAFAAASNSHGVQSVGLTMEAQYLSPAKPGTVLVAEAEEEDLGRRTALYRIVVREQETGTKIAVMTGRVYRLDRPVLR
jgi:acyl-CoA thioesterase